MKIVSFVFAMAFFLAAPAITRSQTGPAGVNGTWRGPGNFAVILKQDGSQLMGAARACGSPPIEISDGVINSNTITFKCKSPEGAQYVRTLTLRGEINGDDIEFTWEMQGDPGPPGNPIFPSLRFTAKRAPDATDAALSRLLADQVRKSPAITFDRILHADKEPQNWLTYSGTLSGLRYSPLTQITPENALNMELAWIWQAQSSPSFEATPIVANGVLYTVQAPNDVVAIDAATGRLLWTYPYTPKDFGVCCGPVNRGLAILGNTLFMGTLDSHLLAIDTRTGKLLWNTTVANATDPACKTGGICYAITHAPLVVKNKVIVGTAGSDDGPRHDSPGKGIRGLIAAFDVTTGKEVWSFSTIPAPGEPGNDTWSGDSWKVGGGGVWNAGSYDAELNLTYWGTGNPNPMNNPELRLGDNLYTDSIVALDADTGKLKWHYQLTPHDENDWDAANVPVLADIQWQGQPRKVMLWANKNGLMYVLDRASGQFLMGKPFVEVDWLVGFDEKGRPIRAPNGIPIQPETGTNWMPPSYSPSTGLFYIPSEERRMFRTNSPGFGAVRAFDPRTGEKVWEFKNDSYFDGVLTTASDVLFAGTRYLYALNARTGEFLWQTPLAGLSQSGPMSYSVDDKQYVAVTAGNNLFAFALRPDVTLAPTSAAAPLVASASVNEGARSTAIDFVRIAPGSFQMGCSVGDSQCDADEKPSHRVAITRNFEIGKYEVTQEQWQAVMGTNPSLFKGDKFPVSSVNWNEAQEFLSRMNSHKDGYHYRLPTEAEWEYAARAGTTGAHAGNVDQMAWYDRNAGSQMHPVGQKQANAWGLYDMEGNVREWVQDWFGPYESNSSTDPVGPDTGNFHVLRGGSWSFGKRVSVSLRDVSPPQGKLYNFGFRCVREAIR